jgi:site-specific recombinase XerD
MHVMTAEHIRTVMSSTRDAQVIQLWLEKQPSLHTKAAMLDAARLLEHAKRPLVRITLADLQNFAQSLIDEALAPISRVRTLAAIKNLFGFCSSAAPANQPGRRNWRCPRMSTDGQSGLSMRRT